MTLRSITLHEDFCFIPWGCEARGMLSRGMFWRLLGGEAYTRICRGELYLTNHATNARGFFARGRRERGPIKQEEPKSNVVRDRTKPADCRCSNKHKPPSPLTDTLHLHHLHTRGNSCPSRPKLTPMSLTRVGTSSISQTRRQQPSDRVDTACSHLITFRARPSRSRRSPVRTCRKCQKWSRYCDGRIMPVSRYKDGGIGWHGNELVY